MLPQSWLLLPFRQLPFDLVPVDAFVGHEDGDVEDEVGDLADHAAARFAEGGDDDFGGFLADFLDDAGAASAEELCGVGAFGAILAAAAQNVHEAVEGSRRRACE